MISDVFDDPLLSHIASCECLALQLSRPETALSYLPLDGSQIIVLHQLFGNRPRVAAGHPTFLQDFLQVRLVLLPLLLSLFIF